MKQSKTPKRGILIYELNEVPWKVLDAYIKQRPASFLANKLGNCQALTTICKDEGELHPWSTWPTLHRGVSNSEHGIKFINQDKSCAEKFPPIWEILSSNMIDVGVFGSLQSYPPPRNEKYCFYVPDTFAPDSESYPNIGKCFQEVNLRLAGKNKAIASGITLEDAFSVIKLLRAGVRPANFLRVIGQLALETIDNKHKGFRPAMQPIIGFDVFLSLMSTSRPKFATFFTNHVAGLMHRYWKNLFPEDFSVGANARHQSTIQDKFILRGMDIADRQIETMYRFAKTHSYEFIVASSMGQEAVDRGKYIPELIIRDDKLFVSALGYDTSEVVMRPSMQPDVVFEAYDDQLIREFAKACCDLTDENDQSIFAVKYPPRGGTLNLSLRGTSALADKGNIVMRGRKHGIEELGLKVFERDQGTGYHVPEGVMLWWGDSKLTARDRQVIDTRSVLPTILDFYGLPVPAYCKSPSILSREA